MGQESGRYLKEKLSHTFLLEGLALPLPFDEGAGLLDTDDAADMRRALAGNATYARWGRLEDGSFSRGASARAACFGGPRLVKGTEDTTWENCSASSVKRYEGEVFKYTPLLQVVV